MSKEPKINHFCRTSGFFRIAVADEESCFALRGGLKGTPLEIWHIKFNGNMRLVARLPRLSATGLAFDADRNRLAITISKLHPLPYGVGTVVLVKLGAMRQKNPRFGCAINLASNFRSIFADLFHLACRRHLSQSKSLFFES